jgi:hypothetical protein
LKDDPCFADDIACQAAERHLDPELAQVLDSSSHIESLTRHQQKVLLYVLFTRSHLYRCRRDHAPTEEQKQQYADRVENIEAAYDRIEAFTTSGWLIFVLRICFLARNMYLTPGAGGFVPFLKVPRAASIQRTSSSVLHGHSTMSNPSTGCVLRPVDSMSTGMRDVCGVLLIAVISPLWRSSPLKAGNSSSSSCRQYAPRGSWRFQKTPYKNTLWNSPARAALPQFWVVTLSIAGDSPRLPKRHRHR